MDVWSQRSADHRKRFKKVGALKGCKTKPPEYSRKVRGNLRFPLDFTYHGCPVDILPPFLKARRGFLLPSLSG